MRAAPSAIARLGVVFALLTVASGAGAQDSGRPVTLDQALALARAANAQLPVARLDVLSARERLRGAEADRGPRLSVRSDLVYTLPGLHYGVTPVDEERLQLVAEQPVYEGGALGARVEGARADLSGAGARYRVEERQVEYEVRVEYGTCLELNDSIAAQTAALARLGDYLTWLDSRQAAGQGVAADVLRTRLQLETSRADLLGSERRLASHEAALNDLMGRPPRAVVSLAPLPDPVAPGRGSGEPWRLAPDLAEAESRVRAAEAGVRAAEAAHVPHVALAADTGLWGNGLQPEPPGLSFGQRLRNDLGASIAATVTWDFWDAGAYGAQARGARLAAESARASLAVAQRRARLEWETAAEDRGRLYAIVLDRRRAVPTARDAYLLVEAQYRGGVGTVLDVLTAFRAWVDAEDALASAVLDYRIAAAAVRRWGPG